MRALIILSLGILVSCSQHVEKYHKIEGPVFGTSYHITYEYAANKSLEKGILHTLKEFNSSLSTYDPGSVISRFNVNDPSARADDYFKKCFRRAKEVSLDTDGAFDMTVAPLVNVYGFGFTARDSVYPELIDSLLEVVGYQKLKLVGDKLVKEDPRIMLDASAIAKGFGVDVVASYLESKGVTNYLVEIGGELHCSGVNPRDSVWRVGIDKPIENLSEREIEAVLNITDLSMATSGNYRQFYVEGGIKYSHTIDPSTGRPVQHSLLSASVIAHDCMTADAYATAFMVMGLEKAQKLVAAHDDLEAYLIFSGENGELQSWASEGIKDKFQAD